jgi:hypothetical protein
VVPLENLIPEHDRAFGVRSHDAGLGMVDDGSQKCEIAVAPGGGTGAHAGGIGMSLSLREGHFE